MLLQHSLLLVNIFCDSHHKQYITLILYPWNLSVYYGVVLTWMEKDKSPQ